MDGVTGFKSATGEELPQACTVTGPFHVVSLVASNLDQRRRRIRRQSTRCGATGATRATGPGAPYAPAPACSPMPRPGVSSLFSLMSATLQSKPPGASTSA